MQGVKRAKQTLNRQAGELVLQNGRQAGARRPLGNPTTFLGRGQGCDVRLNVDGVDALHCVLVFAPDGVHLRDLNSIHGTYVNGERIEQTVLQHGDQLKVGPFHFRIELAQESPADEPADAAEDTLRESVRIQAAAIAAQQIALEEEEARLQKRLADLQQQEEQLAAHLAEKQRQVDIWSAYTKAERETLRKEKIDHENRMAQIEEELARGKEELAADHQKLSLERQHITKVYQRLRKRWQRQWSAEKEKQQKQVDQLEAEKKEFAKKQAALREREQELDQDLLAFNTERETRLRQLQEGRDALKQDRERWRNRRSREFAALTARRRELAETQVKIAQARRGLVQEKDAWERQHRVLQTELHGLNNRIVHQRLRLQEQDGEIARLDEARRERLRAASGDAGVPDAASVAIIEPPAEVGNADAWRRRCDDLDRLAGDLADQRALLVEQYARLAEIQESWQRERDAAAAELDALAQRLIAEEQTLGERAQQATVVEELLRDRQAEMEAMRQEIVVCQTQLKAREQAFEMEQQREIAAVRQKEALLEEQLAGLAELRARWNRRRLHEVEQLEADRKSLEREQSETHAERVELFAKNQQLAEEKRFLAEKALALEEYRQEVFLRAKDPSAQRRVERLRRRWLALNSGLIGNARTERDLAAKDLARLEECRAQLREEQNQLAAEEAALAARQVILDEREASLSARQARVDEEIRDIQTAPPRSLGDYPRMTDDVEPPFAFGEDDVPPIERAA